MYVTFWSPSKLANNLHGATEAECWHLQTLREFERVNGMLSTTVDIPVEVIPSIAEIISNECDRDIVYHVDHNRTVYELLKFVTEAARELTSNDNLYVGGESKSFAEIERYLAEYKNQL